MQLKISLHLIQFILYYPYQFLHASPLVGRNVRAAEENEFPFIVPIKFINETSRQPENDYLCAGSIISRKFVLSVAHVLMTIPPRQLEIRLGSVDLRQGRRIQITQCITYEMWAAHKGIDLERASNDVSLLRLAEILPAEVILAHLSPMPPDNLYGQEVLTAAWGRRTTDRPSRFLRALALTILSKLECKNRIESLSGVPTTIHDQFFCSAAEPFAFIRNGDSGAPILYYGGIVGINKGTCPLSENDLNPRKVNIHTGIDFYRYFIVDITNNF